jgi:iron complex outermembrane receptor protein
MMMLNEDNDYNFFNPKGGINYQITPKMRLYASVARTNREPSRNSIKDAVVNKKTIEPETLIDYELGYSYKSKIFSGELNLYYMDFENQIVPTGEFLQNGYYIMTNVDKSYRSGIELTARVTPHRKLNIEANATFSRNRIKDYVIQQRKSPIDRKGWEYQVVSLDHTISGLTATSPSIITHSSATLNIVLFWPLKICAQKMQITSMAV